jgi:two-component system response regulator
MPQTKLILLVEDNPDDELLTLDALKEGGMDCEIIVTRDGEEALDYLFATGAWAGRDSRVQPGLMLLDLKLPKLNGFDVLERVRADERTRIMPVVLLTTSSQDEDMVHGYRGGANSFVRKPVQFARFGEALGHLGRYWLTVNEIPSR